MRRISLLLAVIVLALGISAAPRHLISRTASNPDFVHFESGQVHPAVLTPSGNRLLVVNTPDNRLTVFDLTQGPPSRDTRIAEIPVGMEPVAVAALDDNTAWVVNNLSDDVSIVDLNIMHVRKTLRVGDEPNDVVFAGTPGTHAYVSVSNEDAVKVYDPSTLSLVTTIPINGRMPRALARNAAGTLVYVAVFQSGNHTSILSANEVPGDSIPQDTEFPRDSIPGHGAPRTGLIVQQQPNGNWLDMYGNLWNSKIKYSMADVDVAEINTGSNAVSRTFGGIGSINFGLAVNPVDGRVAMTNTETRNQLRFEPRLIGYLVETQCSFVSTSGTLSIRKLDPHIDFSVVPGTQTEADSAIGIPTGVAFSSNGLRAYVTSFATDKLGVLNPNGGATTTMLARVPTVAGPTGVVVDDARGRIYVVGRFRNQLETLSSTNFSSLGLTAIGMDPTPDAIVNGRKFFYGGFTSAHGDQSCATCHVFGDMDNASWDLGDPMGQYVPPPVPNPLFLDGFDPMKGPMITQTLRGLTNLEPFHWRGDRTNIAAFNGAFVSLLGRATQLADSEMAAFSDFVMPIAFPPNPSEFLTRTMSDAPPGSPSASRGQEFFMNTPVDGSLLTCNNCHTATSFGPGTNRIMIPNDVLLESQDMKVPQLRNLYKKTGFTDANGVVNKRGFGFTHDGAVDNLFTFLQFPQFNFGGPPAAADAKRRDVEAFLLAFDTGTAPAVGYQITFDGTPDPAAQDSMATLEARATAGDCDLVAKGRVNGQPRGWQYVGGGLWQRDKQAEFDITSADLRALAGPLSEVTVTGVPKGSGFRMGLDRDRDGYLDGDELDAGSDPGNPLSNPTNAGVGPGPSKLGFALRSVGPNPFRAAVEVQFTLGRDSRVDLTVYDVLGRKVQSVAKDLRLPLGQHTLRWDGRDASGSRVSAGVYFIKLRTEGGAWTRTVVHLW